MLRRNTDMDIVRSLRANAAILQQFIRNAKNADIIIAVDAKRDFSLAPSDIHYHEDITKMRHIFEPDGRDSNYRQVLYIRNGLHLERDDLETLARGVRTLYDMDEVYSTDTVSLDYIRPLHMMPPSARLEQLLALGWAKFWMRYECKKDEINARKTRDVVHYTFFQAYVRLLLKYVTKGKSIPIYFSTIEADFLVQRLAYQYSSKYDAIIVMSKDTDYYSLLADVKNAYLMAPSLYSGASRCVKTDYLWRNMLTVVRDRMEYIIRLSCFYGNDYIPPCEKYIQLIPTFMIIPFYSIDEYVRIDDSEYYKRYVKVVILLSSARFIEGSNPLDMESIDTVTEVENICKMVDLCRIRHSYGITPVLNHDEVLKGVLQMMGG